MSNYERDSYNDVIDSIAVARDKFIYEHGKNPSAIFMTSQLLRFIKVNSPYWYERTDGRVEFMGIAVKEYRDLDSEMRYYLVDEPGEFHWFSKNHLSDLFEC